MMVHQVASPYGICDRGKIPQFVSEPLLPFRKKITSHMHKCEAYARAICTSVSHMHEIKY
eukprot:6906059-Prymnesium_polylepis.1